LQAVLVKNDFLRAHIEIMPGVISPGDLAANEEEQLKKRRWPPSVKLSSIFVTCELSGSIQKRYTEICATENVAVITSNAPQTIQALDSINRRFMLVV
jgi:hypothetical protein